MRGINLYIVCLGGIGWINYFINGYLGIWVCIILIGVIFVAWFLRYSNISLSRLDKRIDGIVFSFGKNDLGKILVYS